MPSDSSDDKEWTDMNTPKKAKKKGESKNADMPSLQNTQPIQDGEGMKQSKRKPEAEVLVKRNVHLLHKHKSLPDTRSLHNLDVEGANHTLKLYYMGKKLTTSGPGRYGREGSQVLCYSF